jgi:hypothetical protein
MSQWIWGHDRIVTENTVNYSGCSFCMNLTEKEGMSICPGMFMLGANTAFQINWNFCKKNVCWWHSSKCIVVAFDLCDMHALLAYTIITSIMSQSWCCHTSSSWGATTSEKFWPSQWILSIWVSFWCSPSSLLFSCLLHHYLHHPPTCVWVVFCQSHTYKLPRSSKMEGEISGQKLAANEWGGRY